jgi:RND superfamily putative drug exporter
VAAFGLSLVFTTLLLVRTREEYVRSGDLGRGLAEGMRHTAAAATGIGLVMLAAIVPFAGSGLINIRQSMIAIAVVVLLDIVVVRPVLMPAAVRVLGHRIWWPTRVEGTTQRLPQHGRRLPHIRRRPRPVH